MRDSAYNRSSRLTRPSPFRSLSLLIGLIALALLLLLLDQSGRLGPVRSQAETLLNPLLRSIGQVREGVLGASRGLSTVQQLQAEVEALREENSRLKAEIIKSESLALENQRLREQLGIEQERPWELLGAEVAAHTPDAGRHMLMIAAGAEHGVEPGMAVIGRAGSSPPALIGVIETVGPRSASVLLITDYGSALSAIVYHNNQVADGIVQGQWQRGSRLRLEEVPRSIPIAPGDVVVTAGLTAQFGLDLERAAIPRDVPIGTIEQVESGGYSQSAEVRPFVDPDQVRYAWVLLSHDG